MLKNQVKESEMQEGFIVAYDLPSENRKEIVDSEAYTLVRATRVYSVYRLHSLGVECTESVIMVSPSMNSEVSKTIENVYGKYRELNRRLKSKGLTELPEPLIKTIKLTSEQKIDFKTLAERRLKEKLDEAIERLANLLEEVENIVEEEKKKRIEYNVNRQRKELERVKKYAEELNLECNNKFELLEQLYSRVVEKLG